MKKWLRKLADNLKILSGKAVEPLFAMIGSVLGAILNSLGKAFWFVDEHTWALIISVAGLIVLWLMQKVELKSTLKKDFIVYNGL